MAFRGIPSEGEGGRGAYGFGVPFTPIQRSINAARPYAGTDVHRFAAPPGLHGPAGPTVNRPPTILQGGYTPPAGPSQIRPVTNPYHPNPYGSPPAGTPPGMNVGPPGQPLGMNATPIMQPIQPPAGTYIPQPTSGAMPPPPIVPATGPFGPTAGIPIRSY